MQVYLNVIPDAGDRRHNEVILLDSLTRRDILAKLVNVTEDPDRYLLAGAESIQNLESIYDEEEESLTLTEYLKKKDIVVSDGSFHLLATRVTKEFVKKYGQKPKRVHRQSPTTGKNNFRITSNEYGSLK
ncbi:hypothetical protein [Nostoc sp. LPT]|uniref:hypothetical protein n=1 Tax=Nostoc sp. LPT TaxID=2815387 RepID=UPI001D57AF98|nr:hypothetical protein [Nostoc sp. LPT]MBN4004051.1 hypothetical protein [Nostoc sp. LPT]